MIASYLARIKQGNPYLDAQLENGLHLCPQELGSGFSQVYQYLQKGVVTVLLFHAQHNDLVRKIRGMAIKQSLNFQIQCESGVSIVDKGST